MSPSETDALSRVPFELLGQIFVHCHRNEDYPPSANAAPLMLCHVCSTWRTVACSLPRIWDTLLFWLPYKESEPPQAQVARVASFANLAKLWFANVGNSTLSLTVQWYGGAGVHLLEDLVLKNSNRLRKFDLFLGANVDFARLFALPSGHLNHLESIALRTYPFYRSELDEWPVFRFMPRLRKVVLEGYYLSLIDFSASSMFPLPWAQLTHLRIHTLLPSTKCRALLRECVLLERCDITTQFTASDCTAVDKQATVRPNLVDLAVHVCNAKSVEVDQWFHDFRFPALEELELQYANLTPRIDSALDATLPLSSLRRLSLMYNTISSSSLVSVLRATTSVAELCLWPVLNVDVHLVWDALFRPPDEASHYVLPCLEVLALWVECDSGDGGLIMRSVEVVQSRWRPPGSRLSATAYLQRVTLHFTIVDLDLMEQARSLLRLDGLDVQIYAQSYPEVKSERW